MKISQIKTNKKNPRFIKDEKFKKLVNSIKEFPKMMELRPIIVDEDNTVLGGNMRLKALKELNYTEIPDNWVKKASDLTDEEKNEFIVKDNVGFGDWDWELLANEWNSEELEDWGLDLPKKKNNGEDLFNIDIPFYKPSEIEPEINELASLEKVNLLKNKIKKLNINKELKEILTARACFFTDFNFDKVADYYYNIGDEGIKEVFKDLGLVIIAPKEALDKGFISLSEFLVEL